MVCTRSSAAAGPITPFEPKRKQRIRLKKWQTDILQAFYQKVSRPDEEQLDTLAAETELDANWIRTWLLREKMKSRATSPAFSTSASESVASRSVINSLHLESPLPGLTRSPSLGYIPLAFALSEDGPTCSDLLDRELYTMTYGDVAIPEIDNLYNDLGLATCDNTPVPQSESQCLQMISQVSEQLICEAEAAAAAQSLSYSAYNDNYSSFYAGVPDQPSLNPNDFSAYSLSTMLSQYSVTVTQPQPLTLDLQDDITSQIIFPPLVDSINKLRSGPPSIAMSVKLCDLVNMTRRVKQRYEASVRSAYVEKERIEGLQSCFE